MADANSKFDSLLSKIRGICAPHWSIWCAIDGCSRRAPHSQHAVEILGLPAGALMFKTEYDMRKAGTWKEAQQTRTETICPYCGVGCELTVHAQEGQIVKVSSPLDHSVTQGNLCIKGRFGWQFTQIR